MKRFILVFTLITFSFFKSFSQLTCNNWLYTPSYQSYVSVGDLDIPGNQITVEAVFNRIAPYTVVKFGPVILFQNILILLMLIILLRPNNAEITTTNGYFRTPDICEIQLNKTYHVALVYDGVELKVLQKWFFNE